MSEYLSPGVYVEELDVGVRPIEGVSTSTGAMIGLTERGPVNVAVPVTSFGEFRRIFGGFLRFADYGDLCHLPHAVDGFFRNGGRQLFVTRVVADEAANPAVAAGRMLFDRGEGAGFADTRTLKHGRAGDEIVLVAETGGLGNGDAIRLDDGVATEYLDLAAAGAIEAAADRTLALRVPLPAGFVAGTPVTDIVLAAPGVPFNGALDGDHGAGGLELVLDPANPPNAGVVPGAILQIGAGAVREYVIVDSVPLNPAGPRVRLRVPLAQDHGDATPVELMEEGAPGAASVLSAQAAAGDGLLLVDDTAGFLPDEVVRVQGPATTTYHVLSTFHPLRTERPVAADRATGTPVQVVTLDPTVGPGAHATTLGAAVTAGERTVLLDAVGPLAAGELIRLGPAGPLAEFHRIDSIEDQVARLAQPVALDRPVGEAVTRVDRVAVGAPTHLVQDVGGGEGTIFLADAAGFADGDLVEVGAAGAGDVEYGVLEAPDLAALNLATPTETDHRRGALFGRRNAMISVQALDVGPWGNELTVSAGETSLLETTVAANTLAGLPIPLTSVARVEVGTILDFDGRLAKVAAVDGNEVTLVHQGAPFPVAAGDAVRTREFTLQVRWSRDGRTIQEEALPGLSLDDRHSRYVERIVGQIQGPIRPWDRRPEGGSDLIRVDDQANSAQSQALFRVGPDLVQAAGFGGALSPVGLPLAGGANPLAGITADTVIGTDHVDPDQRTGMQQWRNVSTISMVAAPGNSDQAVQQALIEHCERERYRFALLDSIPGGDRVRGAMITEAQDQRNLYDSRYAALFYPWLVIRDPFPLNPQNPNDFQLPPSGHMMGVYARTDIQRGVHKAPANERIQGIASLQRKLNGAEQDLLNPINVNVLRDFRDDGLGLRVWGARCLTSDTDWKYVNVRRLFLFIEKSLERGTQWVVFEPNGPALWARVRQSIGNFLTSLWADGALLGATAEESFFVRCDRSTMTQDDLDNGRLIVEVGVAPTKPAEFVIIRIFQATIEAAS